MMKLSIVVLLALAGCPKQPTPEPTLPPKSTPQQCSQVADHLVGLIVKNIERTEADNEMANAIRR